MLKNERGSALITVFLVFLVLTTLGMAIMSATINASKRTERKETYTQNQQEALTTIDEAINALKIETKKNIFRTNDTLTLPTIETYRDFLGETNKGNETNILKKIENQYGVTFEALYSNDENNSNEQYLNEKQHYVRKYKVKLQNSADNIYKVIYLTPTPSFLKFAIGSEKNVTLNGGSFIDGDIYAGDTITTTDTANYILIDGNEIKTKSMQTAYPGIDNEKKLLFNYGVDMELINPNFSNETEDGKTYLYKAPYFKDEFLSVDFLRTYEQKLNKATFGLELHHYTAIDFSNGTSTVDTVRDFTETLTDYFHVTSVENLKDAIEKQPPLKSILIEGNNTSEPLTITLNDTGKDNNGQDKKELALTYDTDKWIVINDDVVINSEGELPGIINANILINGNLTLSGNIDSNATIYVLGTTELHNANIKESEEGKLVLMSNETIKMGIIDSFSNKFKPNLDGYFYTDKTAEIYAVGSYIHINGGLFAKDGLTINAIRGKIEKDTTNENGLGPFTREDNEMAHSRFYITHDNTTNLLMEPNQLEGLPLANGIDIIVAETKIR